MSAVGLASWKAPFSLDRKGNDINQEQNTAAFPSPAAYPILHEVRSGKYYLKAGLSVWLVYHGMACRVSCILL